MGQYGDDLICPECGRRLHYIGLGASVDPDTSVEYVTDQWGRRKFRVRWSAIRYGPARGGKHVYSCRTTQYLTFNLDTGRLYHLKQHGAGMKWKVQPIARPRVKVKQSLQVAISPLAGLLSKELTTQILQFYNAEFPEWPIEYFDDPSPDANRLALIFRALQTPVWTLLVRSGLPGLAREIAYSGQPLPDEHATDPLRALNITSFELELLRRIDCYYFSDRSKRFSLQSDLPSVRYQTYLDWEGLLINLRSIIETWRVEDLRRLTNVQLDNLLHLD